MGTMEDQIRKIVREEIARALGAVGAVADGASQATGEPIDIALRAINKVMERVARDVLANTHPALEHVHAPDDASTAACTCSCRACFGCTEDEHTASTEPVHTITAVPERARAACTCHRHTHVMGHDDRCGAPFCYCLSPVRAQPEHASTEAPRTCSVCSHGEHDQGKCGMHVYLRGVPSPCPCLASRTLGAQPSTEARNPVSDRLCSCGHYRHEARDCPGVTGQGTPFAAPCECEYGGRP